MKYVKKYKMFVESLTQTDLDVNNHEQLYSGEYPNVKVNGKLIEQEPEVEEPKNEKQ